MTHLIARHDIFNSQRVQQVDYSHDQIRVALARRRTANVVGAGVVAMEAALFWVVEEFVRFREVGTFRLLAVVGFKLGTIKTKKFSVWQIEFLESVQVKHFSETFYDDTDSSSYKPNQYDQLHVHQCVY